MKNLFNKRFLTALGIILVLVGIPLTTFFIKNQTIFKSIASNSEKPQKIQVTNITDASFTLTYQTELPSTGSISYGVDRKLGESELEDVDKEKGSFSPKKIHSISVKKLAPDTKYYLTIISGANTFLNNGSPFEIATGPNISSPSAKQNIIKGKIILPDGSIPSEGIVYLNTDNSQILSSVVTKDGKFSFSLKDLRSADLSSYFNTNNNTVFKIVATNGSLKSTTLASLNNSDSIPTITLSNNYDFIQETSPTASKSAQSSFPSITTDNKNSKPSIGSPKENQSFTNQKPQFSGTSLPNEKVEIIIHSNEEITTQVTSDSNGNWIYKPTVNLSPGTHTITIKTRDSSGILTTIMQSFTVFAADSGSSITPSPTPIQVTSTPIPSPTFTPIESKGGLPPTGYPPIFLISFGIIVTIFGTVLYAYSKKT